MKNLIMIENYISEQSKSIDYVTESFREQARPKNTLKDKCLKRAKENGLFAVYKILQEDNAQLDSIKTIYNIYGSAYGFTAKWFEDEATVEQWRGNKQITFKTYKGEQKTFIPKEYKKDNIPPVDVIISFVYLVNIDKNNMLSDTPIIKCIGCGCSTPKTTYCHYCGLELEPRTITIGNNWDLLAYYDKQNKNTNK